MATPARSCRDFAALEARRFRAARLFAQGESQGAVARALGVTRVTAHYWYHAWQADGRRALKAAGRAGRKPKLGAPQWATIERALRAGPRVAGFSTDLWTLPRVAEVIERLTQVRYQPGACVAPPARAELVPAASATPCPGAGRDDMMRLLYGGFMERPTPPTSPAPTAREWSVNSTRHEESGSSRV